MLVLSREEVRQLDVDAVRELGIPSLLLMENAARGAVDVILEHGPWRSITIVCGPGNNGGDGLAIARLLAASGIESRTLLMTAGKELSQDAQTNRNILAAARIELAEVDATEWPHELTNLDESDLLVDALLGTGVRAPLNSEFTLAIHAMNASRARRLSIDVPSGLDCDTGQPVDGQTAVRAWRTVTFAAMKQGYMEKVAAGWTGTIDVRHIGLPEWWLRGWLQKRRAQW